MTSPPWLNDDGTYRCFYCNVGVTRSGRQRDADWSDKDLLASHALLWNRPLPNGETWNLVPYRGYYLRSAAPLVNGPEEWSVGSDNVATTHTNALRDLARQIPDYANAHLCEMCRVGAYLVFPNIRDEKRATTQKVRRWTLNQARGCDHRVFDRWDLTLEAIRLYYAGVVDRETNPLGDVLEAYGWFFDAFGSGPDGFQAYVEFFFLTPLVHDGQVVPLYGDEVRFGHASPSVTLDQYLAYIQAQRVAVRERNRLITDWWTGQAA